jgi:hypothetical protein
MPPKSSAAAKSGATSQVTVQSLYDASDRLAQSESPAEADFRTILAGANAGNDEKAVAAQLIARYIQNFPKLQSQAVSAMVSLASENDLKIRRTAIKDLPQIIDFAKEQVSEALFNALGDADANIVSLVTPLIGRSLKSDEEFRTFFFKSILKQKPESQVKMIDFARDEMTFTEESVPQLLEVIEAAFKSCMVEGLRLFGKNKKLLTDEQSKPLIEALLNRLEKSLRSNFSEVATELLPKLFPFTRVIGDEGAKRLLRIVSGEVLPKFDSVPDAVKIEVLQKVSDLVKLVDSDKLLEQIYTVFLTFPKQTDEAATVNFSIIEATLWCLVRLAPFYPRTASKLFGTLLVYTGQPEEQEGILEDAARYAEFTSRLQWIMSAAESFVQQFDDKLKLARALPAESEEAKKAKIESIQRMQKGKNTGNNSRGIARVLLSKNPLHGNLPERASWKWGQRRNQNQGRRGQMEQGRQRRGDGNGRKRDGQRVRDRR